MRQHLLKPYGEVFDIPSEAMIQRATNSMFQRRRKGISGDVKGQHMQRPVDAVYSEAIDAILIESGFSITPASVLTGIHEIFSGRCCSWKLLD